MARATKASGTHEKGQGSERGTSATQLLRKDHHTVKQLLDRYEKTGDRAKETKQRLFSEIEGELETHATVEEEIFYPAVQEEGAAAVDLVKEAIEEHNLVKILLREIGAMSPEDEEYDAKMKVLKENVEHHIQEEESEMFPKAEQLSSERLQELGSEMQARKDVLAQTTLKRIVSGVTGFIFGSAESKASGSDEGDEQRGRSDSKGGRGASGKQRGGTKQAQGGRGGERRGAAASDGRRGNGAGRQSAAKSAGKAGGAKKRASGRSEAQKRASASAKKRASGRSAEARGTAQRRSSAKKRGTGAAAGGRRRSTARKTAKKR